MLTKEELYPCGDDLAYEEELLRNPFSLKLWWRYLMARSDSQFTKRLVIYERALKALPGSYKVWYAYLRERVEMVRKLPITDSQYEMLNNTFERALVTMHRMPRIWIMYLQTLTEQKLVTRTRRTFDRALCALPVTQHDRIWELYLVFVSQQGMPVETSLRVYDRYLKYDPSHIEDLIEFLVSSRLWQECAERLGSVVNDDQFVSIKGKTKHRMWLELCDLLNASATASYSEKVVVGGMKTMKKVDDIIRGGIRNFGGVEVGRLWTSLAEYYIRRNLHEKARDIYEEGMASVVTVRDFSVIWDAYIEFEQTMLAIKMNMEDEEEEEADLEDARLDVNSSSFVKKILDGFWLNDDADVDLRLARLEKLTERRAELASSVVLRQNPHNVEQWHRRVKLFEGNPRKQISTYTEAVTTVDPVKAVGGKPHTLWIAYAKLYEREETDIGNARVIFDKAVQVRFKAVDDLASVWCAWAEMEIQHGNLKMALELMRRATAEPCIQVKQRVASGSGDEPVQMKLYKSLRLWTLYVDLEKTVGSLESTRAVYESILHLRIATPQIIINYAALLEENNYFEDAFKVYERGIKIFKYPHDSDIWETYLCKFVKRYGKSKLERSRELFEHAIQTTPPRAADQLVKRLYLEYAKLEEDYGLAKRAMKVYEQATKAVPDHHKLGMYQIYIARAAEIFGVPKTREIYEDAIQSGHLPDKDVMTMCLKYAELEKTLGEMDRARGIYVFAASQFADHDDAVFWNKWHHFEVQHGNEGTFREMLRIKRSVVVSARQLLTTAPAAAAAQGNSSTTTETVVKFMRGGEDKTNKEDIQLPQLEEEEVIMKDVPKSVYTGSVRMREDHGPAEFQGARDRFKRQKSL